MRRRYLPGILFVVGLSSCGIGVDGSTDADPRIDPESDERALATYKTCEELKNDIEIAAKFEARPTSSPTQGNTGADSNSEAITNNQVQGVEEADLVKTTAGQLFYIQ